MSASVATASGARQSSRAALAAVMVLPVLCNARLTSAQTAHPVTQATQPATTRPTAEIHKSFEQLADSDAQVRELARTALMGLSREELPALRDVVERSRPLQASQAAMLRDIVIHVYLAGDAERSPSNQGFLGVRLDSTVNNGMMLDGVEPAHSMKGVLIRECMPGFNGFRFLRDGDLVLGILAPVELRTPDPPSLISAISSVPPLGTIRLELLRHGRIIQVSFPVNARPLEAHDAQLTEELLHRRSTQAEGYWKQHFSKLLESSIS